MTKEKLIEFKAFLKEKDIEVYNHGVRVAKLLLNVIKFNNLSITKQDVSYLLTACLFHDIGKVMIDKRILQKKGPLTAEEYEEVKKHPIYGYNFLSNFPMRVRILVFQHHEKLDGSGYPLGLKGNEIDPLSQLLSLADVSDVILKGRDYKKPKSINRLLKELKSLSGKWWKKDLTEYFIKYFSSFV